VAPRPEASALYAELLRLTEEMHAAARGHDEAAVADLAERREVIVTAIGDTPVAAEHAGGLGEIVRRVLALDGELLGLLRARSDATREALDEITARRRSMQSYRGTPPDDPLFIERLG
jgi:hypothetical protein